MIEVSLTTIAINLPAIIVVSLALYVLRDGGGKSRLFCLGLFLVLLSGLLAIPTTAYLSEHYESFMASLAGTSTVVGLFGILHAAGLLLCLRAFVGIRRNAT